MRAVRFAILSTAAFMAATPVPLLVFRLGGIEAGLERSAGLQRENLRLLAAVRSGIDAAEERICRRLEAGTEELLEAEARARRGREEILSALVEAGGRAWNPASAFNAAEDSRLQGLLDTGERAFRDGEYLKARGCFAEVLALLPESEAARTGFALAEYRTNPLDSGSYGEVRRLLEGSRPALRGDREVLEILAEIALAEERWRDAGAIYRDLADRFSGYDDAAELSARAAEMAVESAGKREEAAHE